MPFLPPNQQRQSTEGNNNKNSNKILRVGLARVLQTPKPLLLLKPAEIETTVF